jgi:hypothetical protein
VYHRTAWHFAFHYKIIGKIRPGKGKECQDSRRDPTHSLHHKLFDRGVFTFSDKLNIVVSESANGTRRFREWVVASHGHSLTLDFPLSRVEHTGAPASALP